MIRAIITACLAMLAANIDADTPPEPGHVDAAAAAPASTDGSGDLPFDAKMSGRYERKHTVRDLAENVDVESTDFLEIKVLDESSVSFDYQSWHTNGHSCTLSGTAKHIGGGIYEYAEKESSFPETLPCAVRVYAGDKYVAIEDVHNTCRIEYCGMRGYIGVDMFSQERRIDAP